MRDDRLRLSKGFSARPNINPGWDNDMNKNMNNYDQYIRAKARRYINHVRFWDYVNNGLWAVVWILFAALATLFALSPANLGG